MNTLDDNGGHIGSYWVIMPILLGSKKRLKDSEGNCCNKLSAPQNGLLESCAVPQCQATPVQSGSTVAKLDGGIDVDSSCNGPCHLFARL